MNLDGVEKIADAILYEGYLLYPYRPSAVKNRRRFNFGALTPRPYCEAQAPSSENWMTQTECLVLGDQNTALDVKVRFLHLRERRSGAGVEESWQEAVEREVDAPGLTLGRLLAETYRAPIFFPSALARELQRGQNDEVAAEVVRRQEAIEGTVELKVADCGLRTSTAGLFKITARILNHIPFEDAANKTREEALLASFVSTHMILAVRGGEFISLLDPPEDFQEAAAGCQNIGAWPVLAGREGECNLMLSSPIILYDYPQIAPESSGDLFDGTEIDEILLLRILTLTEEEKREMRSADDRARRMLERVETLPDEELMKLHGALRNLRSLDG